MSNHKVNKPYIAFVRTLPCCHCRTEPSEAHHIIGIGMGKTGGKANDISTMSLCRPCHTAVHDNPTGYPQARWMCETQDKAIDEGVL